MTVVTSTRLPLSWDSLSANADHYERGELLLEYALDLPLAEYWRAVADTWQDCERQDLGRDWLSLWTAVQSDDAARWQYVMDDKERAEFEALPDRVTLYRGISSSSCRPSGLSWTLDRDVAHWFAARFEHVDEGVVLRGTVVRSRILALFQERDESEVVVPPKYVYNRKYEAVDLEARGRRLGAAEESWKALGMGSV